ncbi:Uma2 family endonuclease [Candidatus Poribacteria bacterium]|nr:MAG: Uma2 family endonuclease [Candidatus Poribacteria bacterium]
MQKTIKSAPTILYPESDGKPMAETDTHRDLITDCIQTLEWHYREEPDVYVSGNLLVYYEPYPNPRAVAPDVFVVHGVSKKQRRIFVMSEENKAPDFVLEVGSRGTYRQDLERKKNIYAARLGVKEYYIYIPYGVVEEAFMGFRLVEGAYERIEFVDDRLSSTVLGLELGMHEGALRFYHPQTQQWLRPPKERVERAEERVEHAEERAEHAEERAERAEAEAAQEARARRDMEEELAEALAEIQRLQAQLER